MSTQAHPNISVLKSFDIQDLDACRDVLADGFIWHYVNPHLPELHGDYHGFKGLKEFFTKLGGTSGGTFQRNHIETRAVADEFVVSQVCNRMTLKTGSIEVDAIVIWRIVDSKIAEAWDIPAINTVRTGEQIRTVNQSDGAEI